VDGAKYERELMDILQAAGNFVVRSAGSHNTDLVVISLRTGAIMIVEVKSFTGNVYSVRRKKKEFEQWQAIMNLIKTLPSFITVRYALRQKSGKGAPWRLISPAVLERPYHWDAPIVFDIYAPSTQGCFASAPA
jgi:Holliday junction resolvase